MNQPQYRQPVAHQAKSPSPWDELAGICESLRALAQQVNNTLQQGTGASVLVPLLRQELALARSLQEGIVRCGQQPASAQSRERSASLSEALRTLLETEQTNQGLLQRRGIRLRGPRSPLSRLNCP